MHFKNGRYGQILLVKISNYILWENRLYKSTGISQYPRKYYQAWTLTVFCRALVNNRDRLSQEKWLVAMVTRNLIGKVGLDFSIMLGQWPCLLTTYMLEAEWQIGSDRIQSDRIRTRFFVFVEVTDRIDPVRFD